MLTLIPDLPAGVVGVQAHGTITADDYQQVLVPAVEAAQRASSSGKARVLYVLGEDFPDFTAGAVWSDTRLGLGHLRSWERIAIVTDADWLRHSIHGLGWMMPGDVRVFPTGELDEARSWVVA